MNLQYRITHVLVYIITPSGDVMLRRICVFALLPHPHELIVVTAPRVPRNCQLLSSTQTRAVLRTPVQSLPPCRLVQAAAHADR